MGNLKTKMELHSTAAVLLLLNSFLIAAPILLAKLQVGVGKVYVSHLLALISAWFAVRLFFKKNA